MRAIWFTFAAIAVAATAAIWMFAAGWSGRSILFPLPDRELLQSGEYVFWGLFFLALYAPPSFAIYAATRAFRSQH